MLASLLLGLLAVTERATGASSGIVDLCGIDANWGCTTWEVGDDKLPNRLECIDNRTGIMDWTEAPAPTDKYTVRTGDEGDVSGDSNSYTPGAIHSIFIRTLDYDYKWRGITIYAVSSSGETVGEWLISTDELNAAFHTPPCPGHVAGSTLLHVSAEIKPFKVRLQWKAPVEGTGTVKFKAMIKRGPANEGWFYFPNGAQELTLTESSQPNAQMWITSTAGQTCTSACAAKQMQCNPGALNKTAESTKASITASVLCLDPIVSTCTANAPLQEKGFCYLPESGCTEQSLCDAATSGKRLCPCGPGEGDGGTLPPGVASSAGLLGPSSLARLLTISSLSMLTGSRSSGAVVVLGAVLASFAMPVEAHNWVHTPGRTSKSASTVRPCLGRKASDLHAQVGPGQEFVFKWATGHSRPSYVVTVRGEDKDMLADPEFIDILEEYLTNAPAGSNDAMKDGYQRYHGVKESIHLRDESDYTNSDMYAGKLTASEWLDHPRAPTEHMYKYNPTKIAEDVRVSYKSETYPWLLAVFKYQHLKHLPSDYDAIKLSMPAHATPGHHIVHWRWNGYYDCTDVDYRPEQVDNVYGESSLTFLYNKQDHCQYVDPMEIVTECLDATFGADTCKASMPGWSTTRRWGINVVSANNPASVFPGFADTVNIPWNNRKCVNSKWTLRSGTVTESTPNWDAWKTRITKTADVVCTEGTVQTSTLKEALQDCSALTCEGISWEKGNESTVEFPTTGDHEFTLCTGTATSPDTNFDTYMKNIPAVAINSEGTPITASFSSPSDSELITLPDGWLKEVGLPFGANTPGSNIKHGFQCQYTRTGSRANRKRDENNTYIHISSGCSDNPIKSCLSGFCDIERNIRNDWEVEVPNGLYEVAVRAVVSQSSTANIDVDDCYVENTRLALDNILGDTVTVTVTVEVHDGRLTLGGNGFKSIDEFRRCENINRVTATRKGEAMASAWLPGTAGAWRMLDLGSSQEVGLVSVINRDKDDCGAWWLYSGDRCPFDPAPAGEGRINGFFKDQDNEGAVVGVSDTPCTDAGGCGGTVCGRIEAFYRDPNNNGLVTCDGKRGRYVYVFLPGNDRVMGIKELQVNKPRPDSIKDDTMVCYGVRARRATETEPEYIISEDPEDPVFYSTCYVREENVTWLPTGPEPTSQQWHFNGECLDCQSYADAENSQTAFGAYGVDRWVVDDKCVNCDKQPATPTTSRWVQTLEGGRCSGSASYQTCEDRTGDYCIHRLYMPDGQSPRSEGQCLALAERSPECGRFAFFRPSSTCYCHSSEECCGLCTTYASSTYKLFELEPSVADPGCSTGVTNDAKKLCCPATCINVKTNETLCGTDDTSCRSGSRGPRGQCCSDAAWTKKCTEYGPPCTLD